MNERLGASSPAGGSEPGAGVIVVFVIVARASSRRGVEFVDLATGENTQNHWVRSGCLLGNLPCNGLLYAPPYR